MQRYKNLQKQEINSTYSTYSIHSIIVTTKKQEAPPSIMTVKPRV